LAGASEVFDIEPYYNHYDRILTGIAMGRQGKFQHLWDAPAVSRPAAPTMSQAEVIAALEKLAGLKEKGILTDAEYQEQKKKLLAQT
jgi:hypothetical protein